jgi:large subunit ribosomal protein L18
MKKEKIKVAKRIVRKLRIRAKVSGTKTCPRLSVFKSNAGMNLQIINDINGKTLVSAHSREIKLKKEKQEEDRSAKVAVSFALGKLLASKAQEKKISQVVFDRGGYRYHGRVKAAADGARAGGLKF